MLPPRPSSLPRGADGLPSAPRRELRAARAVAAIATAWFALAAAWELFGPILAGHYASSASVGIIAENMLRWSIPGPVWEYTTARPRPDMYYCHHPWGIFWTTAAFMKVFGRHDFVCRLPAVLLSAATPALLYAIGRSVWRPAAGAAAAAAFVVLPITLAFAHLNALEVPVMAWTLLGVLGYVRFTQTWRRRWAAVSVLGLVLGMHADWPGFLLAGGLLAFGAARAFALPRAFFGPVRDRRYAAWWALCAVAIALTAATYLALFQQAGKLGDLLGSYGLRASGNQEPLRKVLEGRRYWIELSFTPIAIAMGKAAAVVCAGRLVLLRREHEVLPLLYLLMASVQYVVFRQGADIHIFWPQYFGAYFALATGALVESAAAAAAWVIGIWGSGSPDGALRPKPHARRRGAPVAEGAAWPALAALGLALIPIAAIARDGIPALRYARETGGRFNEKGLIIDSDGDKTVFLRWLAEGRLGGDRRAPVEMHEGMKTTWAQIWALGGRVVAGGRPIPKALPRGAWLADTRLLPDAAQEDLVRRFRVAAVGPFWAVGAALPDGGGPPGIQAFSFREREPGPLVWYLISGTEPQREITEDPWLAWELAAHFGQPAAAPDAPPETLEQKRIAHNAAVAAGDEARAGALSREIEAALSPVGARFDDGTEIVGTTFHDGARRLLTLFVRAGGPLPADAALAVRSQVVAPAPLSTTMADPVSREVGLPTAIAPQRWRRGFLYADPVPIRKRPGTEVFLASFRARGAAPKPVAGPAEVEVLRLR